MGDIIVISVILFFVGLAVRSMWKDHKKGGCAGCSGCSHSCHWNTRRKRKNRNHTIPKGFCAFRDVVHVKGACGLWKA